MDNNSNAVYNFMIMITWRKEFEELVKLELDCEGSEYCVIDQGRTEIGKCAGRVKTRILEKLSSDQIILNKEKEV